MDRRGVGAGVGEVTESEHRWISGVLIAFIVVASAGVLAAAALCLFAGIVMWTGGFG